MGIIAAIEFVIESSKTTCVPLLHKTHRVGIIRPDILKKLEEFSNVFISVKNSLGCCTGLRISEQLNCPGEVTVALDKIFLKLRHDNVFPCLKGWRDEVSTYKRYAFYMHIRFLKYACRCML